MSQIKHLGIIMDGNRRWAKEQGLAPTEGHTAGYEKFKQIGDWCLDQGIEYLTVYAFSTENWKRQATEVNFLMTLFKKALSDELDYYLKKDVKLNILGDKTAFSPELQALIQQAEDKTKNGRRGTLNLAINYGGRAEIVTAIKRIIQDKKAIDQIDEDLVASYLYTAGQPDPDLIIRTSGEQRTSGFLTWQGVYSELYFLNKHWPAVTTQDLKQAVDNYAKRHRRFGGN